MTALVPPRLEVVADERGVEAAILGDHREAQKLDGAELLR